MPLSSTPVMGLAHQARGLTKSARFSAVTVMGASVIKALRPHHG